MSQGVFVNKVGKGQKYWFVDCSIPKDWIRIEMTYEEFARQPGQLKRLVAEKLNAALLGREAPSDQRERLSGSENDHGEPWDGR